MKNKSSVYCLMALAVAVLPTSALVGQSVRAAEESSGVVCDETDCLVGDYNVGGGGIFEIGAPAKNPSGAVGFFTNAEGVYLGISDYRDSDGAESGESKWYVKDITFFDGRLMSFIGASGAPGMDGTFSVQFRLKMVGSIGGGMMLYQIFPVSLALEDASLEIQDGQVAGGGLLGSTVAIPLSLLASAGLDETNFYISMTAGVRLSSELADPGFALQPKVRFITDKVSLEARGLFTVGSEEVEKKGALIAAMNHVFVKGDQVGLLLEASRMASPGAEERKGFEVLFFYGRNL